ncbi:MAG TPA: DUF1003 domain-containing protein [Solirubrobacteraceae bacterium]|jgi:uncharacterized membrane protein|nr:DUF1003 domain-containing protein [Solirubrobacteraceae bacterium]
MTLLRDNSSITPRASVARESASVQAMHKFRHSRPPKLADERDGLNDRIASFIAQTVGSMWMFYISIIAFAIWMAGLGATVAGDHYPFNLMLLAVGGIMQWLAMIAILVAQNAQGSVQDKQVEHLHDLGMTTHRLVVENTALTKAIHDHFIAANTERPPLDSEQ